MAGFRSNKYGGRGTLILYYLIFKMFVTVFLNFSMSIVISSRLMEQCIFLILFCNFFLLVGKCETSCALLPGLLKLCHSIQKFWAEL
jgi:hypothetical protein